MNHAVDPSPVVALNLNRAIAVAEVDGPEKGLTILDVLHLETYRAYQAARADLLRRAGQHTVAGAAHRRAIELTSSPAERTYLRGRSMN